eukprot:1026163-Amphidinium_carterae.1
MVERSLQSVTLADETLSNERRAELLRMMTLPHASQFLDLVVPCGGKGTGKGDHDGASFAYKGVVLKVGSGNP